MGSRSIFKLFPLFFVIAIDSMGLGILFPILSELLINPHSHFFASHSSEFSRELWYGITIGIYMIAWFFGSAILGDLSDMVGRKKSLMICLVGAVVGYVISGVAIAEHSLFFLIVGRVIAGFTAGSQPIAQAAIVDVSTEETRARNIGYIFLAVSLGFVLGPFMGGILSNTKLVSWFNFATPLYFAAILSLLNCILLFFSFKETFVRTREIKLRLHYAIQIFIEAFKSKRIRMLSLVLLIETAGWSEYFTFVSQLLLRRFHYTGQETSFFIGVLAIGFSIGFGLLVNPVAKRFNLKNTVIVNLCIAATIFLITAISRDTVIIWIGAVLVGMSVALLYSLLITLFSNQVGADEQGWVMGITSAVSALSFGVSALLSGFAADFGAAFPIYLGCVLLILAAFTLKKTHLTHTSITPR